MILKMVYFLSYPQLVQIFLIILQYALPTMKAYYKLKAFIHFYRVYSLILHLFFIAYSYGIHKNY
jgi:hypothetical protein